MTGSIAAFAVVRWRCRECGRYVATDSVSHVDTFDNGRRYSGLGTCVCAGSLQGGDVVVLEADRKATT